MNFMKDDKYASQNRYYKGVACNTTLDYDMLIKFQFIVLVTSIKFSKSPLFIINASHI